MIKKQIVVVGGGAAGALFAHAFGKRPDTAKYGLTLITKHAVYQHFPGVLRPLVSDEGDLEDRVFVSYDKLFQPGRGTLLHGTVAGIESGGKELGGNVILENGEKVPYDVLVLATGNSWEGTIVDFPVKLQDMKAAVRAWRKKILGANHIVIAGGGAVGIEMAGEIKHHYPNKKVTIVHGQNNLLRPIYPDRFRSDVSRRVKSAGISIIFNDYLENIDEMPARTRNGIELDGDLIISSRGGTPRNEWIAHTLGKAVLSDRGYLNVRPTLQVEGYDTIFGIGDMIEWAEDKMILPILFHSRVATANILDVLEDRPPKSIYKGSLEVMILTIGKTLGASFFRLFGGLVFGNWITSTIKGNDLYVSPIRKALGHPV